MRSSIFFVSLAAVASAAQDKRQFSLPVEPDVTTISGSTITRDPFGSYTNTPTSYGGPVPSPTSDDGSTSDIVTGTPTTGVTIPTNTPSASVPTNGTSVIITSTKTEGGGGGGSPTETDGGASSPPSDPAAMATPFAGVGLLAAVGLAVAL